MGRLTYLNKRFVRKVGHGHEPLSFVVVDQLSTRVFRRRFGPWKDSSLLYFSLRLINGATQQTFTTGTASTSLIETVDYINKSMCLDKTEI